MWIGSATQHAGDGDAEEQHRVGRRAARKRKRQPWVKAISTIGKANSAGVSAVPTTEIADSAAQAPRIQRVLTFQFGPLLEVCGGRAPAGRAPSAEPEPPGLRVTVWSS